MRGPHYTQVPSWVDIVLIPQHCHVETTPFMISSVMYTIYEGPKLGCLEVSKCHVCYCKLIACWVENNSK